MALAAESGELMEHFLWTESKASLDVARDPKKRFASAKEMSTALSKAVDVAHAAEISDWLKAECAPLISQREKSLTDLQRALGGGTSVGIGPADWSSGTGRTPPAGAQLGAKDGASEASSSHYIAEDVSGLPKKLPRWVAPAALLGVVGVVALVIVLVSGRQTTRVASAAVGAGALGSASAAAESASATVATAADTTSSALTSATHEPSAVAASATAVPSTSTTTPEPSAEVAATSASARPTSAPVPIKPKAPVGASVPSAKRKCRIVTSMDAAGHTTFAEVCQ
jgi:serine/threonine-protein kinase